MTEPLSFRLEVACSAAHAFAVWTSRIDHWWLSDHTASGRADAEVVLEPYVGGRIYERTPDGTVHDWGEVTVWEPPHRLGYLWPRLGADADIWRDRNRMGWTSLLPHFTSAAESA
jgi:hypothetical protein